MCFICSDLAVPKNRQIYLINGIYVHVYTKCTFKCKYVYNGLIKKEGVQKVFGTLVFVVRHVVYFDTSHISTPFPVTSAFETVMDFPV